MIPEVHALANGVQLAVIPVEGARTCAIEVGIAAGPAYETVESVGLGHLAEHALLRRCRRLDAEALGLELDGVASEHDGATRAESVSFSLPVVQPRDVPRALALVGELVASHWFDSAEIEAEKRVVLLEVQSWLDGEGNHIEVTDLLHAVAIDGPMGLPVCGTRASVGRLTASDLTGWHERHCTGRNLVVAAAGDFDVHAAMRAIEASFGNLPSGERLTPAPATWFQGPRIRVLGDAEEPGDRDPESLVQVAIGLRGDFSHDDRRADVLDALVGVLDGGASSRLFDALRLRSSLAYEFGATAHVYSGTSLLEVSATCLAKHATRTVRTLLSLVSDLATRGPSALELSTFRGQVRRDELAMSPEERAKNAVDRLLHGMQGSDADDVARLASVEGAEVAALAGELLAQERLAVVAIGDVAQPALAEVVEGWRRGGTPPAPTIDPRELLKGVEQARAAVMGAAMNWAGDSWLRRGAVLAGAVALTSAGRKRPRPRARRRG